MGRIYRFGDYQINAERRTLLRGAAPVPITSRAFDILLVLLEQRHRVVDKDELLTRVWPDQVVEESNLSQQVFVLRRLLGEGQYIATIPRRGYQFVAPVDETTTQPSRGRAADAPRVLRLDLPLRPPIVLGLNPSLAISRDGRLLVYVGEDADSTALFLRRLDAYQPRRIVGTERGAAPFLSPDGRWVGFSAGGRLQRVAIDGGTPLGICEVDGVGRGATWGPDNLIVFAPVTAGPLLVVAAAGGAARPLTQLAFADGERSHRFPSFTPDGQHVIFTVARAGDASFDQARLAIAPVDSGHHRVILEGGSCGILTAAGQLHYQRAGTLFSTNLDQTAQTCDQPGEPIETISVHDAGAAHFAVADFGLIVSVPPMAPIAAAALLARDESGGAVAIDGLPRTPEEPRISPDGGSVVIGLRDETSDLWLYHFERRTLTRLTEVGDNFAAIWTRDGRALVFSSNRRGPSNIYRLAVGALDAAEPLIDSAFEQVPGAWTADGETLIYTQYDPQSGASLWLWSRDGATQPLTRSRFNEYAPALSPDGQWLAYTSDATGSSEVYILRFPELIDRQQISRGGGSEPVWAHQSSRLYYRSPTAICRVDIQPSGQTSEPHEVMPDRYIRGALTGLANYDVHPDGRLFVVAPAELPLTRASVHVVVPFGADQ